MIDAGVYERAAARCARWAVGLLADDGFAGAQGVVLGLYKAPVGLLAAGHAGAAAGALRVAERFFHRDGDFHARANDPTPAPGRTYRNAWLAWGAQLLGAYHLSAATLDRIEQGLHPRFHGSTDDDTVAPAQRLYPAGGTAQVASVLLACGRKEAALRAGSFLGSLVDEQPAQADRVLLVRTASGPLLDPDVLGMKEGREFLVFDLQQPNQICWIFGLMLRVFAQLHRATGDSAWLTRAERIHGWLMRSDASLHANVTNAKVAWGAAEMYGATGKAHWLVLAQGIGNWLVEQQGEDGIWLRRPQFSSSAEQPVAVSLDTSIERMFYMIDIPRALALAPASA